MTQELIANMLGVRREGVTEAAGQLHKAGLIEYQRGHITVLDRAGLEQRTCECYGMVKEEYDRLLPDIMQAERRRPQPSLSATKIVASNCTRDFSVLTRRSPVKLA
jgi:DNA-binding transcriptional regulator YhcF (GntR family)